MPLIIVEEDGTRVNLTPERKHPTPAVADPEVRARVDEHIRRCREAHRKRFEAADTSMRLTAEDFNLRIIILLEPFF